MYTQTANYYNEGNIIQCFAETNCFNFKDELHTTGKEQRELTVYSQYTVSV